MRPERRLISDLWGGAARLAGSEAPPFIVQVAIGIAAAALASLLRWALIPLLGDLIPWATFLPAVLLAATFAGGRAGVVTLVACLIVGRAMFAEQHGGLLPADFAQIVSVIAFTVNAGLVVAVAVALRATLRRARAANEELHGRQRVLTEQVADLTALHRFGTSIVGNPDRDDLLGKLLEAAIGLQAAERGFIELLAPDGRRLTPGVSVGHVPELFAKLADVPVGEGEGACGTCAARRGRVIVEDVETDPIFERYRDAAREAGFRAVWSTPLLTRGGELVGVLSTHYAEPRRPGEREVQLVELYARLAADALESAALYNHAEGARREAEQAAAELRAQDRRKDEFLAMLAHELRNPLAPIRTLVDTARLRRSTGLSERELQMLDRQTTHLARIVDDLLDVARITHGKIELRSRPVALDAVVARAVDSIRPLLDERGHVLRVAAPPATLVVNGDPVRLEQVLLNVLGNAARYTEPGGKIELSLEAVDGMARIRVADNGAGIAAGSLDSIFDLFEQGPTALARSSGGLGIGLTIVRKLVELHDGRVSAASAGPGRGSEFTIDLPLLADSGGAAAAAEVEAREEQARAGTGGMRVLIVDDNADAALSLAELVADAGYETRVAHDGPSAVTTAQEQDPNVVLLDIGLPGMDGYEVARALRRDGSRAVIIAITGYGQASDFERSRAAGFAQHWVKPVRVEVVLDGLDRASRLGAPMVFDAAPPAGESART